MDEETKVQNHPAKDNKTPSETIATQLVDAEKKKKQEELKKSLEEVIKAREVLVNAVSKAQELEEDIRDMANRKLDLKSLAKALDL